jgi:hypothetical protein
MLAQALLEKEVMTSQEIGDLLGIKIRELEDIRKKIKNIEIKV